MRDIIDFLVQLILAIFGAAGAALALTALWVGGICCALWGGSLGLRQAKRWWQNRRRPGP